MKEYSIIEVNVPFAHEIIMVRNVFLYFFLGNIRRIQGLTPTPFSQSGNAGTEGAFYILQEPSLQTMLNSIKVLLCKHSSSVKAIDLLPRRVLVNRPRRPVPGLTSHLS